MISIRRKSVLSRKPGRRRGGGGRHVAKSRSVPRVANPEVKVQVRDLVRAVGIGSPFATRGVGTREKFVLWSPRGQMGIGDLFRVPQAAV